MEKEITIKKLTAKIAALKESKKVAACNKKCQDKIDANIKQLQSAIDKIKSAKSGKKIQKRYEEPTSLNTPVYGTPSKGTRT
mgnify:CR=1 FL=1|tara:strand:- start:168 stop:413 length:246 start_codon:yes stop_codon:yes gene_type:complete